MPTGIYQRKPVTQTTKNKISKALKQAWAEGRNTGITGMKHTKATKLKMSQNNARAMLGKTGWNKGTKGICKPNSGSFKKGVKHTELWKKQHSDRMKVLYYSKNFKSFLKNTGISQFKKGHSSWTKGIPLTIKHKKRLSENHANFKGKNSSNWLGGKSFEPYGIEFNNRLREQIRQRDHYRCQQCFRCQDELYDKNGKKYSLHIHHIDYNKENNNINNLISLCRNCHSQTNFKREDWTKYFQKNRLDVSIL